jgi:iron complex outermembrane receptor protein
VLDKKLANTLGRAIALALPGLTLIGGVFYTGEQQVDSLNTYMLPSFTTDF